MNEKIDFLKELAEQIIDEAFRGKTDKAGAPYYVHLYAVARKAKECRAADDRIYIAGLLHDILEDCPEWTEKALRCLFPALIVNTVVELTRQPGEAYTEYIERIRDSNDWVRIIKKADLEHNMNISRLPVLTDEDFARLKKYHESYIKICAVK